MSSLYLHDIPLDEANAAWYAQLTAYGALAAMPAETVPLAQALGRITAAPVLAKISSPHYHASAMDGYAVRSDETYGASESVPKRLTIGEQAIYVDTGDPLPAGLNAVIMREHAEVLKVAADAPAIVNTSACSRMITAFSPAGNGSPVST